MGIAPLTSWCSRRRPLTTPNDAYDILFGAPGTTAGTQGFDNNALDVSAADSNLSRLRDVR